MLSAAHCGFFATGVLLGVWGPAAIAWCLPVCVLPIIWDRAWCLGALLALAGLWLGRTALHIPESPPPTEGLSGVVESASFAPDQGVRVRLDGRAIWLRRADRPLCPGDRVELLGSARRPAPGVIPTARAPWRRLRSRGAEAIVGRGRALGPAFDSPLCQARQAMVRRWYRALPEPLAWLGSALTVGARPPAGREVASPFRDLGLAHVLAVSGLHIGMISFILVGMLRGLCALHPKFTIAGDTGRLLSLLAAIATSLWCGMPVGGMRVIAWRAVAWLQPHRSPLHQGLAALAAVAVWQPLAFASAGFLLSFSASLGLVGARRSGAGDVLKAPLIAAVVTAPVQGALAFPLAWVAPLANVVFGPLFLVVFACVALAAVIGDHALSAAGAPISAFVTLAQWAAELPGAGLTPIAVSLPVGLALAWGWAFSRCGRPLTGLALLLCALHHPAPPDGFRVWQIPVGHGDLAIAEAGKTRLMIDTGPGKDLATAVAAQLLGGAPTALAISHAHPDHTGGARALCAAFPGTPLWLGDPLPAKLPGCPVVKTPNGRLGGLDVRALPAADDWVRGPNERSLGLAIEAHGHRALFLGDAEADREADWAGRVGRADLVKVGHHGSRTSSHPALIAETRPAVALIGAGWDDVFGHPHAPVVARWKATGARVETADRRALCWWATRAGGMRRCPELAFLRAAPETPPDVIVRRSKGIPNRLSGRGRRSNRGAAGSATGAVPGPRQPR
jgi:competence protein ComEC